MSYSFFKVNKSILAFMICLLFLSFSIRAEAYYKTSSSHGDNNSILSIKTGHPVEKIYIHFDRDSYFLGDQLWFKVYLVSGETNSPNAKSKVVYVELIDSDNTIVSQREIHTNNGGGSGEFALDMAMKSGFYTVRAYTNYMRNFDDSFFYTKKIYINSFKQMKRDFQGISSQDASEQNDSLSDGIETGEVLKPDLQFFPEGGAMIAELPARIAFKAVSDAGNSFKVKGVIIDAKETELMSFESSHFGMGSFNINPTTSDKLRAKIVYAGKTFYYELPKVLKTGVIMRVADRGDAYQISLQSSLKQGVNGLSLIGEQRGSVVCRATLNGTERQGSVRIPLSTLDTGIVRFTIFDANNKPVCERLVFAETNKPKPDVDIKSSKSNFDQRELVELEVSLDNTSGLPANFSVAVTDMTNIDEDDCDADIVSYLLLDSEIKGIIEKPCYYFTNEDSQRKRNLDLLMMTQGWRNYLWNQMDDTEENDLGYSIEVGKDFKGSIKSAYNHKLSVHSEVAFTYKNQAIFGHDESKTFDDGQFIFPGYTFKDSISIIIEARKELTKKGKQKGTKEMNRDFYIVMDTFKAPPVSFESGNLADDEEYALKKHQEIEDANYLDKLYADQPDYVKLDGVEVKVKREPYVDPYRRKTMRYAQPRFRVDYTKENIVALGNDALWTFLSRTPGISQYNPRLSTQSTVAGIQTYYYRGSRIVFFLDGIRFSSANELNNVINANDVSFIDLLSGPQATVYLCEAAVVVYTKTVKERLAYADSGPRKGIINFNYPGIYQAKEFYKPLYRNEDEHKTEEDYRVTLHWEPNLRVNANGTAKISFYTADPEAKYRVELEGLTLDGYPLRSETYFEVGN